MKSNTLILHTAALFIMPLQLMFSVFLLFRGHDEPGGGFIGGLVAASAFVLYAFAFGAEPTRRILRAAPRDLLAAGPSTIPAFLAAHADRSLVGAAAARRKLPQTVDTIDF